MTDSKIKELYTEATNSVSQLLLHVSEYLAGDENEVEKPSPEMCDRIFTFLGFATGYVILSKSFLFGSNDLNEFELNYLHQFIMDLKFDIERRAEALIEENDFSNVFDDDNNEKN